MARTVVYTGQSPQEGSPRVTWDREETLGRREGAGSEAPSTMAVPVIEKDSLGDKITKYVPAEVIAFFVPGYALVRDIGREMQLAVLGLAVAATVGYLFARAPRASPPRWYFYILAGVSFLFWAIGTTSIGRDLWSFPDKISEFALLVGVLLVPMLDEIITRFSERPTKM